MPGWVDDRVVHDEVAGVPRDVALVPRPPDDLDSLMRIEERRGPAIDCLEDASPHGDGPLPQ